jgi:hypothetical protein
MQKGTILQVIGAMPDDVDLDELLNRLYVLEQIQKGEDSLRDLKAASHDDVKKWFART